MYNRLIFINFISRSKKVKQKSKSCIKHFFTVYKLLRLWYFVSVLNLKFLDQLEMRYCKDTPFFRPFYIGAPKGPFLPGLIKQRDPPLYLTYSSSPPLPPQKKISSPNRAAHAQCMGWWFCWREECPGEGGGEPVISLAVIFDLNWSFANKWILTAKQHP